VEFRYTDLPGKKDDNIWPAISGDMSAEYYPTIVIYPKKMDYENLRVEALSKINRDKDARICIIIMGDKSVTNGPVSETEQRAMNAGGTLHVKIIRVNNTNIDMIFSTFDQATDTWTYSEAVEFVLGGPWTP